MQRKFANPTPTQRPHNVVFFVVFTSLFTSCLPNIWLSNANTITPLPSHFEQPSGCPFPPIRHYLPPISTPSNPPSSQSELITRSIVRLTSRCFEGYYHCTYVDYLLPASFVSTSLPVPLAQPWPQPRQLSINAMCLDNDKAPTLLQQEKTFHDTVAHY